MGGGDDLLTHHADPGGQFDIGRAEPSALLIAPTDTHALFSPMDAYVKAGIPVIAVDTTLANTSILTSAISSDNYQGGEKAADTIASLAHDKGQVAVINVMPNVSTTDLRQGRVPGRDEEQVPQYEGGRPRL